MKRLNFSLFIAWFLWGMVQAQTNDLGNRALWASINGAKDASLGDYQQYTGKVLVSWRMLPGDDATTGFDLYRTIGTGTEKKIARGCGLYTKMSEEQLKFLDLIKPMNIEARYQEIKDEVARTLNREKTAEILGQTKQIYSWIPEKLQEKLSTR